MIKTIGIIILAVVAIIGINFGLASLGMISKSFFGSWNEEIRYDILKESQAHRDGMQRNLDQMMGQYVGADAAGKAIIGASIKHQYSQADTSEYPQYLKDFLAQSGVY